MRLRDTIICLVCIVVVAGLLVVAGMQLDYVNSAREEMRLISNEPLENAPPSLAFATVAMGAFRGLVVDILWMRADALKEQGQFFDAKQLAEWITALQPRFASVWDFHSWNMAYNISVAIPADQVEERWRWVRNGYELLRDKGIPLNPRSILLYHRLAFIFQHKIAGVTDEAHNYYKVQLAMAMDPLLDPGVPSAKMGVWGSSADEQYFDALAEAPTDWRQITEDANVMRLITSLESTDKAFAGSDESVINNYLSLRQNPSRFKPEVFNIIDGFRGTKALKKFDIFAKAWHLRNRWKLDPVLMRELNKLYGPVDFSDPNRHLPLDWRHPDSHAIYWAVKGLRKAGKKGVGTAGKDDYSADEINTDRMVAHSLQDLFRGGKIFIYDAAVQPASGDSSQATQTQRKEIFLRPDLRMFESYNKAILNIIAKYTDPGQDDYNSHQIGHRNMLKNAVLAFYQAGHKRQAQKIYDELRRRYPLDEFKVPLVVFVRTRLLEEFKVLDIFNVKEMLQMVLREGYFLYSIRDDDGAFGREKLAREIYDYYNSAYTDAERIELPEFVRLRYFALMDFLYDEQFSPDVRGRLLGRMEIERPELFNQLMQQEEKLRKQLEQSRR